MTSIETVRLVSAILGITILSACSDGAKLDDRGKQMTSDGVYVSQLPAEFEVDPFWPKSLPNNWILGEVSA
jgi:hypothetical protein